MIKPAIRIIFAPLHMRWRSETVKTHGSMSGRTIRLDPRSLNVARVLLHELVHAQHPGWTERRVERSESSRWLKMSWKQKARLYQLLASARIEGEK